MVGARVALAALALAALAACGSGGSNAQTCTDFAAWYNNSNSLPAFNRAIADAQNTPDSRLAGYLTAMNNDMSPGTEAGDYAATADLEGAKLRCAQLGHPIPPQG